LNISSGPDRGFQIRVDGRSVGNTPKTGLRVPVGSHVVQIIDPASGQTWQQTVVVEEGRVAVVSVRR
jgi:hypothetical protein